MDDVAGPTGDYAPTASQIQDIATLSLGREFTPDELRDVMEAIEAGYSWVVVLSTKYLQISLDAKYEPYEIIEKSPGLFEAFEEIGKSENHLVDVLFVPNEDGTVDEEMCVERVTIGNGSVLGCELCSMRMHELRCWKIIEIGGPNHDVD